MAAGVLERSGMSSGLIVFMVSLMAVLITAALVLTPTQQTTGETGDRGQETQKSAFERILDLIGVSGGNDDGEDTTNIQAGTVAVAASDICANRDTGGEPSCTGRAYCYERQADTGAMVCAFNTADADGACRAIGGDRELCAYYSEHGPCTWTGSGCRAG